MARGTNSYPKSKILVHCDSLFCALLWKFDLRNKVYNFIFNFKNKSSQVNQSINSLLALFLERSQIAHLQSVLLSEHLEEAEEGSAICESRGLYIEYRGSVIKRIDENLMKCMGVWNFLLCSW